MYKIRHGRSGGGGGGDHIRDPFKLVIVILIVYFVLLFGTTSDCKECNDMDIRNRASELKRLEGCTAILGYLQIVLIERTTQEEFNKYVFPELREVTDFILIYEVNYLRTLGQLFPNLSIIRGNRLFQNYALIIYEVPDMEEIGLHCLQKIGKGGVRIERCPYLCDADIINWKQITNHAVNFFNDYSEKCTYEDLIRLKSSEYVKCLTAMQPVEMKNCHSFCLIGCVNGTASGCYACSGPSEDGTCVEKCSETRIYDPIIMRCITREACRLRGRVIYEEKKQCLSVCPIGYTNLEMENNLTESGDQICRPCTGTCPKVCKAYEINYISEAQLLQGCTVLNSSLHIRMSMKSDSPDLMKELTDYLGAIEEIYGYLKIFRSSSITSLEFLKNLKVVHGIHELENEKYAVIIYENNNLQALWHPLPGFAVLNGNMFFHFNSKLCPSVIDKFVKATRLPKNDSHAYVSSESNGNQHTCDVVPLDTNVEILGPYEVTLRWEKFRPKANEKLLGFLIYYVETIYRNVTHYYGTESCSSYSWRTKFAKLSDLQHETVYYAYNLTELNGMSQYAYYIRTEFEDNIYHQLGQTPIKYFNTSTTIDALTQVLSLRTVNKTIDSITLEWEIFEKEVPFINFYYVDILITPDDLVLKERNFCSHPLEAEPETIYDKPEVFDISCCCLEDLSEHKMFYEQHINKILHGRRMERVRHRRNVYDTLSESPILNLTNAQSYRFYFNNTGFVKAAKVWDHQMEIKQLQPFTLYTFQFFACYDSQICSPYSLHYERTEPDTSLDVVTLNYLQRNDYNEELILFLNTPAGVNGAIVAYNIEYTHDMDKIDRKRICLTHHDYSANQTYTLQNLTPGMMYFRAQAVSLAGNGPFTDWQDVLIVESARIIAYRDFMMAILVGVVVFACGFISICLKRHQNAIGFYLRRLRRRRQTVIDDEQELITYREPYEIFDDSIPPATTASASSAPVVRNVPRIPINPDEEEDLDAIYEYPEDGEFIDIPLQRLRD